MSMDREVLVDNIVSVARLAKTFGLPVVLSTINVANGQEPTVPELKAVLVDDPEIDRTSINSWEDTTQHKPRRSVCHWSGYLREARRFFGKSSVRGAPRVERSRSRSRNRRGRRLSDGAAGTRSPPPWEAAWRTL
jgi:hypothetical protein